MSVNAAWIRGPNSPMSRSTGTIRWNSSPRNIIWLSLVADVVDDLGRRQAQPLPHLLAEEPVPHEVAGLDGELLPLVPLGLGELGVVVPQRQPSEHDVPGLVLHHVGVDGSSERIGGHVADQPEGGQGEPLDQHLHGEVREVPSAGR